MRAYQATPRHTRVHGLIPTQQLTHPPIHQTSSVTDAASGVHHAPLRAVKGYQRYLPLLPLLTPPPPATIPLVALSSLDFHHFKDGYGTATTLWVRHQPSFSRPPPPLLRSSPDGSHAAHGVGWYNPNAGAAIARLPLAG